jgi:hypothetical protein
MSRVKQLIDEINNAKLTSPHMIDDAIDMNGVVYLTTVDRDEHRWYTVGTFVLMVDNEDYLGVHGPISLKSESMGFDDCGFECTAFEMEQIQTVTYIRKQ